MPLRVLALSLARNGLETIILDDRAPAIEGDEEFVSVVEELRASQVRLVVERMSLRSALAPGHKPLRAICYATDSADLQEMMSLNQYSYKEETNFLPGFLLGGKALVGPLVQAGKTKCWMCSLLRYAANLQPDLEAQLWRHLALRVPWSNDRQPESSPSLRILGNQVGFEVFRLIVGHIPIETDGAVLSIDLESLESGTSRLLAHPLCVHCSKPDAEADRQFLAVAHKDVSRENLPLPKKLEITSTLVDPYFGIAKSFDDDDLIQTPVFRSAVVLSRLPGTVEVSVPGHSIQSNASARLDAVLSAARMYSVSMPDVRRMRNESKSNAVRAGLRPVSEAAFSGWMGGPIFTNEDQTVPWMHAISMRDGAMDLVPPGVVFPKSPFNPGGFERVDVGIGVGFSFRQASTEAVLTLFAQEVLKRVATHRLNLVEVDPTALAELNADLRYFVDVCGHLDKSVRVLAYRHNFGGSAAFAFLPNESADLSRIAVGTGGHLQEAAAAALLDFLAIATGTASVRTAERYLPNHLGYNLTLPPEESLVRASNLDEMPLDQRLYSILLPLENDYSDILIVNLTTEDIASCGLVSVKALFVKTDVPS